MYLADSAQLQELSLKGSASGKNYIGPPGPPGGLQDREIVAFDGRSIVMRWMNPESLPAMAWAFTCAADQKA